MDPPETGCRPTPTGGYQKASGRDVACGGGHGLVTRRRREFDTLSFGRQDMDQ